MHHICDKLWYDRQNIFMRHTKTCTATVGESYPEGIYKKKQVFLIDLKILVSVFLKISSIILFMHVLILNVTFLRKM